jgi:aspartyl-tRNA(Asn)/glutamyl-tRNA(Gln) amidotransferase subunit A
MKLPKEELVEFKKDLKKKIEERKDLNAYIGLESSGDGVPILIKDNIQVKDWSITSGSEILQGYLSPYDATVISKLRESGLSPFGRANMDEFAMGSSTETSFYGKTLNPHDASRVPGGSSGGSASAVGGGVAIASLGSDTGGSIRQPASFSGVVGLKPTYGRVSRYGLNAYGSSLDQIGPITQTVEDSVILYNAISGYDVKDSTSANMEYAPISPNPDRKLKIATLPKYLKDASSEIVKAYEETVATLQKMGHTVIEAEMGDLNHSISAYYITAMAEASSNLARYDGIRYGRRAERSSLLETYIASRSEGFGDEVKRRILIGNFVLSSGYYDAYYVKAQKVRYLVKQQFDSIFQNADLILSPVSPTLPWKFGELSDPLQMYLSDVYTVPVNLAGLPAISLPVSKSGTLPIGLQLIGKAFDEQTLFDGAMGLERELS